MATGSQGIPGQYDTDNYGGGVDMGGGQGLVRVISNSDLMEQERIQAEAEANQAEQEKREIENSLAAYIRSRMTDMRNFRNAEGISERLLAALRTYKGEYDQTTLNSIQQFGGSEVYARVTST